MISREDQERSLRQRFNFLYICIIAVGVVLLARLFDLQIVHSSAYISEAASNRTRIQTIPAARGDIFDAAGRPLAVTRVANTVSLLNLGNGNVQKVIPLLAEILGMSEESILDMMTMDPRHDYSRMRPVLIKNDVTDQQIAQIEERRDQLPGIETAYAPMREYPYGSLLAHTLGYLGPLDERDLEENDASDDLPYLLTDLVGKQGLERSYEQMLRGEAGQRFVEIDADHNIVRELGRSEPRKGNSVFLTIDAEFQKLAEEILIKSLSTVRMQPLANIRAPNAYSGAVVAIEIKTGRILAMASYPDFDPNAWATGRIANEELATRYLQPADVDEDTQASYALYPQPMSNRALLGALPPGSTFKPVTLAAALELGVVTLDETIFCTGIYTGVDSNAATAPKCWVYPGSHGAVNGVQAIRDSCNVYFLELGRRLNNLDEYALDDYAKLFGLGEATGFTDLHYAPEDDIEVSHRSNAEYLKWLNDIGYTDREEMYLGEIVAGAIGQGFSAFTPLQMALMTMQMGAEGIRYDPYLVEKVVSPSGATVYQASSPDDRARYAQLSESTWKAVTDGMVRVTQPGGTSSSITFGSAGTVSPWRDLPFAVAGKTGTAQIDNDPLDMSAHAWFTCFAPADDPQIAIAMVVEHGRSGSNSCSAVASNLIRAYFDLPMLSVGYYEDPAFLWPINRYGDNE